MKNLLTLLGWLVLCVLVVTGSLTYMSLTPEAQERRNWETYRDINGCKVVHTGSKHLTYRCENGETKERPLDD